MEDMVVMEGSMLPRADRRTIIHEKIRRLPQQPSVEIIARS
jgi:hypothetical protein